MQEDRHCKGTYERHGFPELEKFKDAFIHKPEYEVILLISLTNWSQNIFKL